MREFLTVDEAERHARNVKSCDALKALLELHHGPQRVADRESALNAIKAVGTGDKAATEAKSREFTCTLHPAALSVAEIQNAVCAYFGMTRTQLRSHRRNLQIVRPRQISIWLCREHTTRSFPQIAKFHGLADHTTALHACQRIDALASCDDVVAGCIAEIQDDLGVDNRRPTYAKTNLSSLSRDETRHGPAAATQPTPHRLAEPIA